VRHYIVVKKPGRRRYRVLMVVDKGSAEYLVHIDSFASPKQAERLRRHLDHAYQEGRGDERGK
jgi:hypothetical protein